MSKTDNLLGRLADAKAMLTALHCEFVGYDEIAEIVKEHGERESGCEWCNSDAFNFCGAKTIFDMPKVFLGNPDEKARFKFCPMCGRNLTGEAQK